MLNNKSLLEAVKAIGMSEEDIMLILRHTDMENPRYSILLILWSALALEFPHSEWEQYKERWDTMPSDKPLRSLIISDIPDLKAINAAVKFIGNHLRELERIDYASKKYVQPLNLSLDDFPAIS